MLVQPSLAQWQVTSRESDRGALADIVAGHARRLGTAALAATAPLIATGHQAWLWHPGILAKDIALTAAARRHQAGALHLIVDQDVHPALMLALPVQDAGQLRMETVQLAQEMELVPAGAQPPADSGAVRQSLEQARRRLGSTLACDLGPLIQAFTDLPDCRTAGEQLAVALVRLMQPWTGLLPVLFASDLIRLPSFQDLIQQMLADPRDCAACYNTALQAHPDADIAPLRLAADRVELPLWLLPWNKPRLRVFADLSVSPPRLVGEDHQPIILNSQSPLAPKALLLTAFLRSVCCDLFIHGKGGGIYDHATETWWRNWRGRELAPLTVVSADLHLNFTAPVSQPRDLDRAVWWKHHLPHNLDRALHLSGTETEKKTSLLAHMNDDRDPVRRAAAFAEIHRLNAFFRGQYADALVQAQHQLERVRLGVGNRRIADKRDWCFALYPPEQLRKLTEMIAV